MFGRGVRIFRAFGFEVKVDASWLIILVLITWSLAAGLLPAEFPGLATWLYWALGFAGAMGIFFSILVHELTHSLVARRFGLPIRGITLFIFGGVSEMTGEPASPGAEFAIAIMGPVSSVILGGIAHGLAVLGRGTGWPPVATGLFGYLALVNFILAGFNLLPGFPLDGGRVLRSILWRIRGDLAWATRVASAAGTGLGVALIVLGVFAFISGGFIGGMWWTLIGLFLASAARGSYRQLLVRQSLKGLKVERIMTRDPLRVPPSAKISTFVDDYVYKYHERVFPVADDGTLLGVVGTEQVKRLPREEWSSRSVGELLEPVSDRNTISPEADVEAALGKMTESANGRLMVVDAERHLVGMITMNDLRGFLAAKAELEE